MLTVAEHTILTAGEVAELARLLPDARGEQLTRLALGELAPVEAERLLDLDLGLAAGGSDRAHVLLDRGLDRLAAIMGSETS